MVHHKYKKFANRKHKVTLTQIFGKHMVWKSGQPSLWPTLDPGMSGSCYIQTYSGERITYSFRKCSSSDKTLNVDETWWTASIFRQRHYTEIWSKLSVGVNWTRLTNRMAWQVTRFDPVKFLCCCMRPNVHQTIRTTAAAVKAHKRRAAAITTEKHQTVNGATPNDIYLNLRKSFRKANSVLSLKVGNSSRRFIII